jgi:shikimate dehydrogenase
MSGRRILLLGHPVEHSLSPAFQQAAFDSIGLPVRYEAMDVAPADLARVVAELRADPLVMGANVTVPNKEKIAPLLDSLTDDAVQIGAVNTITRAGSRLVGRNTDAAGFRGALDGLLDGRRTPRHALVLGAGGAAKAAISALVTAGVAQISIANRHLARAERLVAEVRKASPHLTERAAPWQEGLLIEEAQIAGLVVHATTLGLSDGALPLPAAAFRAGQFVIDVVYAPGETALVRTARAAGAEAIDGREMLLLQGAAAFELWTGRPAPIAVMREAFDTAAKQNAK